MLIYGIGRFGSDFLRVDEPVMAGLIPSQYGTIILITFSLYLLINNYLPTNPYKTIGLQTGVCKGVINLGNMYTVMTRQP